MQNDISKSETSFSKPHVLIVDDDTRIRKLVSRYLQENEFIVLTAQDAHEAQDVMTRFAFDAIVLDVMMPGQRGTGFARQLREQGNEIPILLLTALNEIEDRITGLETGADDYLSKPFEPRELVLRLQSIMKRALIKQNKTKRYKIGSLTYNTKREELKQDGRIVTLTTVEKNLLQALLQSNGKVVSRDELATRCGLDAGERTIDVQVTRLRRKIEEDTKQPRFLQTVRGKGYILRAEKV